MTNTRMKVKDLKPEFRRKVALMPRFNLARPIQRRIMHHMFVFMAFRKKDPDVTMKVVDLGDAQVRLFVPKGAKTGAGLVWIHGGGMVVGRAFVNDIDCAKYAKELGAVVASVEYRIAPKHPYPAAIDDCYAVWSWFLENAEKLGVDPERIAISGQSAGGGLSAALAQRILDEGGVQPAAQCLFYPMLDDRTALNEELTAIHHLGWDNLNNNFGWSAYLGQPAGSPETPPWAVPGRRDDLSGLPPTWIGIGNKDLFFDESKSYAARLEKAGIPCELIVVDGAPHGFDLLAEDAPLSQKFQLAAMEFFKKSLKATPAV